MKSQFQDIIPPEKRSIRNITLSKHTENIQASMDGVKEEPRIIESPVDISSDIKISRSDRGYAKEPQRETLTFTGANKVGGLSKVVLWFITLISAVVLFFGVTYFLNSANVNVTIKHFSVDMPKSLNLSLTPSENEVGYSTLTFSSTETSNVPATGEKDSSIKATGIIFVYNNFGSTTQKFTEGTRFEDTKGHVFKLTKAIVVPGKKKVNGKDVAGSIEANVVADKAGEEYNIPLSDFTIPGLKGDPKFTGFYARSKAPMVGGSVGKIAIVSDADMAKVVEVLKQKLNTKLLDRLKKELPQNQVLFEGLSTFEYKVSEPKLDKDKGIVEVTANVKYYLIDSNTLAKVLLKSQLTKTDDSLQFKIDTKEASSTIVSTGSTTPEIIFSGKSTVDYILDVSKFKTEIAGMSEAQVGEIAKKFDAIISIDTAIKPFWKKSMPADINKINITVK